MANAKPGFPDRVELRDAEPGEHLLLLNHMHQPADTLYRASHAIFVREGAEPAYDCVDQIPESLRIGPISLRAFYSGHEMVDADLVDRGELEGVIERFFVNPEIQYLHARYAKHGCYAARVERVQPMAVVTPPQYAPEE